MPFGDHTKLRYPYYSLAFSHDSLTIIKNAAGEDILRRLTPLSGLQEDILQRLGLGASLYGQLEIQVMGN
jgi:hypothetical protein